MIQIAVTTLGIDGTIIEHSIARGETYDKLIEIIENDARHLDLSELKENGVVIKHHVTGNISVAVLLKGEDQPEPENKNLKLDYNYYHGRSL